MAALESLTSTAAGSPFSGAGDDLPFLEPWAKRKRSRRGPPSPSEEEYLALCLIMLARDSDGSGRFPPRRHGSPPPAPTASTKLLFSCSVCGKAFPSYQALGGHKASHRRPFAAPIASAGEDGVPKHPLLSEGRDPCEEREKSGCREKRRRRKLEMVTVVRNGEFVTERGLLVKSDQTEGLLGRLENGGTGK